MNDDENNNPMRKIRILNNKDGTYTRQDFVDDKCVYRENIVSGQKINVNNELLKHKLEEMRKDKDFQIPRSMDEYLKEFREDSLPEGWQDSPIARRAYSLGFTNGAESVMEQHFKTLRTLQHLIDLELNKDCSL